MCGRFFVYDETMYAIERLVQEVKVGLKEKQRAGDIYPVERAMVISAGQSGMVADRKRWGLPGFEKQKVLINAGAETVLGKRMYRECVLKWRIIIPATGFYEWIVATIRDIRPIN